MTRRRLARIAAPVAFLAAVTIAALLVRAGLQQSSPAKSTTTTTAASQTAHKQRRARKPSGVRFYHVRSGDTFGLIAQRLGTTVARLERLNPGVDPSSLHVGERIRVK